MRTIRSLALLLMALVLFPVAVFAQHYPDRPIRLIVPYAPGGSTDLIARYIAPGLSQVLGQAVVVENKGGAGGLIGTAEVARAHPDGYTLGMGTVSTLVIFPATHPKPGYALESFVPIMNVAEMPNVLVVNPKLPAKNLTELIALIKANPGKYTFGTSGKGAINHLLGESFQAGAGVKMTHVPYKGSGLAMQDVMAGNIDMMFDQLPSSKPQIDGGNVKLLGAISPKRIHEYPDVLTMEDVGMKGFTDQAWYGVVAPAKIPAAVHARLTDALKQVLAMPDVRARIEKSGASPVGSLTAEYTAQIKLEIEKTRKLVKDRNISFDD